MEMGIGSFKENIKKYYDDEAGLRNSKSVKADWKAHVRDEFCKLIKQENKLTLLELGAGAGYDSRFFMDNGLTVTAIDISGEMVKNCLEKSIEAYELDYYDLSSLERKFDCVYAINTLLHVPKADLANVLIEINSVLNEDGLFYMGQYGGKDTEDEFYNREVSDIPRFFAHHSEEYLRGILESYFDVIDFVTMNVSRREEDYFFHSVIMRKV